MSLVGTNRTTRAGLTMSVDWGQTGSSTRGSQTDAFAPTALGWLKTPAAHIAVLFPFCRCRRPRFNGRPIRLGREITWKEQEKGRFLFDVPTWKGLVGAGVAIVLFLAVAYFLYIAAGKHLADFELKIADNLVQGALVSLLFATLKAIIDAR
jgi:hypothetical protein